MKFNIVDGIFYEPIDVTANHTANENEFVSCDSSGGTFTVSLPLAPVKGEKIDITKIDNSINPITIDGNGNNILGDASIQITVQDESVTLVFNGTEWKVN